MIAFAQSSIIDQKQKTIVQCSICSVNLGYRSSTPYQGQTNGV